MKLKASPSITKQLHSTPSDQLYLKIKQCCGTRFKANLVNARLKQAYLHFNLHNYSSEQFLHVKAFFKSKRYQSHTKKYTFLSAPQYSRAQYIITIQLNIFKVSLQLNSLSQPTLLMFAYGPFTMANCTGYKPHSEKKKSALIVILQFVILPL